ncbi:MAG: NAD-dependent epimerase/dehydratase family protein [Euryarchaeota archaeon]|nr:NAD-dependent epimerase/dehydratase family protein [Euryarchaeota archaeon]
MTKNEKILVTGGAGFIGSTVVERAIKEGKEVYCLDHREDLDNVKHLDDAVKTVNLDVRNKNDLNHFLKEHFFDGIVHLAAVSRVIWGQKNPQKCKEVNVDGTQNLLQCLEDNGQKPWFIFGSSREVYGESDAIPVSENAPKLPINIYGETKLEGERMVRDWSLRTGNPSVVLRFSNVYGNERDIMDRVMPRFILRSLKEQPLEIHGGKQMIDFTHISDTVDGIFKSMKYLGNGCPLHDDFHLLTGNGTTLQEVADIISDHIGQDVQIVEKEGRNYDVDKFVGEPSKAIRKLNFKADITPEKGIPMTIDLFREVFAL